jgi:hypothetical protein
MGVEKGLDITPNPLITPVAGSRPEKIEDDVTPENCTKPSGCNESFTSSLAVYRTVSDQAVVHVALV